MNLSHRRNASEADALVASEARCSSLAFSAPLRLWHGVMQTSVATLISLTQETLKNCNAFSQYQGYERIKWMQLAWTQTDALWRWSAMQPRSFSSRRSALVTDGESRIGQAICAGLAEHGYRVVALYPSGNRALSSRKSNLRKKIKLGNANVRAVPADLTSLSGCSSLSRWIRGAVGELDLLVHCAGTLWCRGRSAGEGVANATAGVLDAELDCVFNLTRAFLDQMVERQGGRFVTVLCPESLNPSNESTGGSIARAAIRAFAKVLAADIAQQGIAVNTVSVNGIALEQSIEARLNAERRLALAVVSLADGNSGLLPGLDLPID